MKGQLVNGGPAADENTGRPNCAVSEAKCRGSMCFQLKMKWKNGNDL